MLLNVKQEAKARLAPVCKCGNLHRKSGELRVRRRPVMHWVQDFSLITHNNFSTAKTTTTTNHRMTISLVECTSFSSLAQDAQADAGLRHNAVRTPSFSERKIERTGEKTSRWYSTEVIGNRLGKASAFDLHWKWGSERQMRRLRSSFQCLKSSGKGDLFENSYPSLWTSVFAHHRKAR